MAQENYKLHKSATQEKFNRSVEAGIIKIILNHINPAVNGYFCDSLFKFFATSQAIAPTRREGKSGQRRAMHR